MYNPTQICHLMNESLHALLRRKISGSVAILIMSSSLLMLALFSLVTINLDRILQQYRRDIDMTVFLQPSIHSDDATRLRRDLLSTQGVLAATFVSAEQALVDFRAELGPQDSDLLDALESNPLSPSFEVRLDLNAQDADRIEDLAFTVSQYPGVDEVVTEARQIRMLDQVTRIFFIVDLIVGILVLSSALFVISNTVRLTIDERTRQIEIMKLVGATNWFIRGPFLIGGALQGCIAGALAMAILVSATSVVRFHSGEIAFFAPEQMVGFVLLSTLLGAGGSWVALRRHLKL